MIRLLEHKRTNNLPVKKSKIRARKKELKNYRGAILAAKAVVKKSREVRPKLSKIQVIRFHLGAAFIRYFHEFFCRKKRKFAPRENKLFIFRTMNRRPKFFDIGAIPSLVQTKRFWRSTFCLKADNVTREINVKKQSVSFCLKLLPRKGIAVSAE